MSTISNADPDILAEFDVGFGIVVYKVIKYKFSSVP